MVQVMCHNFKCHPTWWPNYKDENVHHLSPPLVNNTNGGPPERLRFEWDKDVYAIHFNEPTPRELESVENLLRSKDTMFAQIGRFILDKANMTKYFQRQMKSSS